MVAKGVGTTAGAVEAGEVGTVETPWEVAGADDPGADDPGTEAAGADGAGADGAGADEPGAEATGTDETPSRDVADDGGGATAELEAAVGAGGKYTKI